MTTKLGANVVTRVRAPLVDDPIDSTAYRDWDNATEVTYTGCMIQPFQLSSKLQVEYNIDREFAAAYFRVWLPPGADVISTDKLRVNGITLEVYGVPGTWFDLDGNESHVSVLCYVRTG